MAIGKVYFSVATVEENEHGKGKVEKKENLSSTFVENRVW